MKKSEIYKGAAKMVMESKMFIPTDEKLEILWELLKESDFQLSCERINEERENNAKNNK